MSLQLLGQQLPILLPAFAAGLLVIATHVPLGREVLRRGIIFMDLAVAQAAALGLILGRWTVAAWQGGNHDHPAYGYEQMIAYAAAMAGAGVLYTVRRASTRIQEAFIGILFVLAATGSILLLSKHPHAGEQLKDVLVGQILWVQYRDLFSTAIVTAFLLLAWPKQPGSSRSFGFYPLFAVAITLSTQLVGIYLVFATLIIPALATRNCQHPVMAAYIVGGSGYAAGLVLSALFDLPSGALIVWTLAVSGGIGWIINAPRAR